MNDRMGSWWRKWDLHFHTSKSYDYRNKSLTANDLVRALRTAGVSVVAVTDHHVLDAGFIREMRTAGGSDLTVLPGIELTSNLGGSEGVHFIAIFSEEKDLEFLATELRAKLNIAQRQNEGTPNERLYVEFPAAANVIQQLGGIITIHGHGKAQNFETISSRLSFKQQVKTDLLRDHVDIIEIGGADHAAPYREKIFPSIGFQLPLVVGSDNHDASEYAAPTPCWIKADPTFDGLRMALREPKTRFWLGDKPRAIERLEGNKTRYIKSIAFTRLDSMPAGEAWMHGEIPLNPGLVAVIGNKGSGKSALSDSLGLLGSSGDSDAFSFLSDKRFRDPRTGRAHHIQATLVWHDGDSRTRSLADKISPDEPARVKYLPQNFVEKVCNELARPGGSEFEQELKKVIFSKVPLADRLGQRSLDELVIFRTQEIRKKGDSLAVQLIDISTRRAALEMRRDPSVRSGLEQQIEQLKKDIASHDKTRPAEVKNPTPDGSVAEGANPELDELTTLKDDRTKLLEEIEAAEVAAVAEQLRVASARKLLAKLDNLQTEFDRHATEILAEARNLGLDAAKLATLTVDRSPVEDIRKDAIEKRRVIEALLENTDGDGLRTKAHALGKKIEGIQERLDRPNREYQAFLEHLRTWEARRKALVGAPEVGGSLRGLEAELANLDGVKDGIAKLRSEQERVAAEIHQVRLAEVGVYEELYGPVQRFVAEHPLAKDHLGLEFKVELTQDGFGDALLAYVNQSRVGSFYGIEEGRAAARALVASVDWSEAAQVEAFLKKVDEHLHTDMRPKFGQEVLLGSQIVKGKSVPELYAWLYGLGYLNPRYILRWDGKAVEQLSPGERGTLLLIFYLLVDDSDAPLIIDQPEANLDNITVAEKLVDCIRDVLQRRQVIIVTHNPNLAVVCDADQIVHASLDRTAGNRIDYKSGAIEHPEMARHAINVLEGGRSPFDMRDETYSVAGE